MLLYILFLLFYCFLYAYIFLSESGSFFFNCLWFHTEADFLSVSKYLIKSILHKDASVVTHLALLARYRFLLRLNIIT